MSDDKNVQLSGKNLPKVKVVPVNGLNVVDAVDYQKLVLTQDAIKRIEGGFGIMDARDIILRPVVTEKSMNLMDDKKVYFLMCLYQLPRLKFVMQSKKFLM